MRSTLLKSLLVLLLLANAAFAADSLTPRNDGAAKQVVVKIVQVTTGKV